MSAATFIMGDADMREHAPTIGPLLERVLSRSDALPLFTASDVIDRCRDGRWQMWGVYEPGLTAVVVTSVETYPLARVLNFLLLVGTGRTRWLPLIEQVHQWARGLGCTIAQVYGRRAWTRVLAPLGYVHQRDILRSKL